MINFFPVRNLIAMGFIFLVGCQPKQEAPLAGQKNQPEKLNDLVCEGDLCSLPVVLITHRDEPLCMGVVTSQHEVLTSARCLGLTNLSEISIEDLALDLAVVIPHAAGAEKKEAAVLSISKPNGQTQPRLVKLKVEHELNLQAPEFSDAASKANSPLSLIVTERTFEKEKPALKLKRQEGCSTIATTVFYPYDLKTNALGVVLKNCLLAKQDRGALAIDSAGRIAGLIEASFDGNKIYTMIVNTYRDLLDWEAIYNRNFALLGNSLCWSENSECPSQEAPTADFMRAEMAGVFLDSQDKNSVREEMSALQPAQYSSFTWTLDSRVVDGSKVLVRPVPACYVREDFVSPIGFYRELKAAQLKFSSNYLVLTAKLNEDFQVKVSNTELHMENLDLRLDWKSRPADAKMTVRWPDFYFKNTYSVARCANNTPKGWQLQNSAKANTTSTAPSEPLRLVPKFDELFTEDTLF